jgi:hypothetical protein
MMRYKYLNFHKPRVLWIISWGLELNEPHSVGLETQYWMSFLISIPSQIKLNQLLAYITVVCYKERGVRGRERRTRRPWTLSNSSSYRTVLLPRSATANHFPRARTHPPSLSAPRVRTQLHSPFLAPPARIFASLSPPSPRILFRFSLLFSPRNLVPVCAFSPAFLLSLRCALLALYPVLRDFAAGGLWRRYASTLVLVTVIVCPFFTPLIVI